MTAAALPRRSAGFTLIELLVGLAILSLAAMLMMTGIHSAIVFAHALDRDDAATDQVAAAQRILRERVGFLIPLRRLNAGDPTVDFRGTERLVEFYSLPPVGAPDRAPRKYRLLLTSPGDLVLFNAPELANTIDLSSRDTIGWQGVPLLRGAASLSLGFFGRTHADPDRKWRISWDQEPVLPELVRIRVTFPDGDRRVWPELILRPIPTVDQRCDPQTGAKCPVRL